MFSGRLYKSFALNMYFNRIYCLELYEKINIPCLKIIKLNSSQHFLGSHSKLCKYSHFRIVVGVGHVILMNWEATFLANWTFVTGSSAL